MQNWRIFQWINDQHGQTKEGINTLGNIRLSFEPIRVQMRRKQIRKDQIFRYTIHIWFMKIEHCIEEQSLFKVGISITAYLFNNIKRF
jgi:hypothetical protein